MAEFKKFNNFNKGGNRGGGSRPSFGAGRGGFDGPKQMFRAECSSCHNSCEVPFRPNGSKPVFCSNCFKRDDDRGSYNDRGDSRDSRDSRSSYQKPEYTAPRQAAPQEDRRIDDIKRQLAAIDGKLEALVQMLGAEQTATLVEKVVAPVKAEKKETLAKVVSKAVAKKTVAPKKAKTSKKA